MTAIRYQPGASYEEQLRIWANGNEDEHRLAVFLEERFPSAKHAWDFLIAATRAA